VQSLPPQTVAEPTANKLFVKAVMQRQIGVRSRGPFGITANCIAPGVIATGRIMATVIPGSIQGNQDRSELVALRRLGTVEDCAKVVEFLATDLSDYVTGAVIPIDGGLVWG
jgi:NAD(P)-dependent dehydrogenase (short-subunit alcohol dehydrogenase family)